MNARRATILAIDDTPANLLTLGSVLAHEFELQFATSGMEGIALALGAAPDLILLDIMMPEVDGFETFRRLAAQPALQHIPVIFVTALSDPRSHAAGLALGAADYITKPIHVEIARQRIRNLLERERLRKLVETQRDQLQQEMDQRGLVEQRLQQLLAEQKTLLENDLIGIVTVRDRHILWANPAFEKMLGYASGALAGAATRQNYPSAEAFEAFGARAYPALSQGRVFRGQIEHVRSDGASVWLDVSGSMLDTQTGQTLWGFVDITERRAAQQQLQLAASVFSHAREGIMITSGDGAIIEVNEMFSHITGFGRDEVLGRNPRLLSSGRHDGAFFGAMWRELTQVGHWSGEVWNRRKNGELYAAMQTISAVRDEGGGVRQYVALFSDITPMKEQQQQLEHIAHFDLLTGLPNRALLGDRLHQAMAQALRRGQGLAVAFVDLDGFKAVNDQYGHETGDLLLVAVAARMKQALRDGDTLARMGGDEFVAVLLDLEDAGASATMLNRLLGAAAQPLSIGANVLQVSGSVGVTFYPQAQDVDADQLLRQADQAMYQAKLAGKNRYHVFDSEQDSSIRGHHEGLARIREALNANELVLHYQPKVNMRSGCVVGAEALIRWQHPQRGLLLPADFLTLVEDHALAVDIGEWVLERALTQMQIWQDAGLPVAVSVNVGARQLQQADFTQRLRAILARFPGVAPGQLELEVLETSALKDIDQVSRVIEDCRELGVTFALDDFGTGYSSLTYLRRLRVAVLKIDRSFVRDMLEDPDDLAILAGVIGLARAFGRQVIAEGVETVQCGTALLQLGCELAQGYAIARPMPAQAFPAWCATWKSDPAWLV